MSKSTGPLTIWTNALFADAENRLFAEGTRRHARVQPTDLTSEFAGEAVLDLTFTLPKGAFATVLLGALIDPSQPFARTEEVSE